MTLDPKVFKAYDVRGVVPDELDADGAYRIARAYVDHFSPKRIAVGHDMRLSSPELSEAAIRGALDAGCDVDDIGLAGTEMMYYAVGEHGYEGGIAVTASHNPAEYNGMKIVRRGVLPVGGDTGLDKMRTIALAGDFKTPAAPGKRGTFPVLEGFTEKVLSIVDVAAIAPLKVVLDGANGMAGTDAVAGAAAAADPGHPVLHGARRHLPAPPAEPAARGEPRVHRRQGARGGRRPRHRLGRRRRPLLLRRRRGRVRARRLHDGTAGRGRAGEAPGRDDPLRPARLARGARHDRALRRRGPCESRVGHAFIKVRMREEDAQFAGEVSGHYYFRDFYSVDTGIVPALVLLELVSRKGGSLAKLIRPLREKLPHLRRDQHAGHATSPLKLQELKDRFGAGAEVSHLDGVSIDFPDWHFNVRPSNTEPLLRLNLEAYTEADMERRRDEVLAVINA